MMIKNVEKLWKNLAPTIPIEWTMTIEIMGAEDLRTASNDDMFLRPFDHAIKIEVIDYRVSEHNSYDGMIFYLGWYNSPCCDKMKGSNVCWYISTANFTNEYNLGKGHSSRIIRALLDSEISDIIMITDRSEEFDGTTVWEYIMNKFPDVEFIRL